MVKYRRLSIEELAELEAEFIRFLAAQSIVADDWVKIKESDEARKEELLDSFSDVVIEKTLFNANYLEQRTTKRILCYKVEESKIVLRGIELEDDSRVDFSGEFKLDLLVNLFEDPDVDISFLLGDKETEDVKKEIFDLLQEGAMISTSPGLYDFIGTLKDHFLED